MRRKKETADLSRQRKHHKMKVRTARMRLSVRFAFCVFILTASVAFFVTTLKPYRELKGLRQYYVEEIQELEKEKAEKLDEKQREYEAIQNDSQYLGLIARDRLHYYKPGEYVFRIER